MAKSRARKLADLIVGAGIDIDGNLTFDGGSVSADLTFGDNDKANFGDASDLQIYHDGNNSYIDDAGVGNLRIRAGNLQLQRLDGTQNYLAANTGAEVVLYYAGSKKFETTAAGATLTGALTATDNISGLNLIATTATYSPIVYGGSSSLQLKSNTSEMFAQFTNNGAAELYYDNSKKLETTSTGVGVTGALDASSQVLVGNNDSIFAENNLRFKSSGAAYIDHNTVGQAFYFRTSNSSALDTTPFSINSGGIGVPGIIESGSSTGALTLIGGATNHGGKIVLSGGNTTDSDIKFYAQQYTASPSERMRITKDGNVGIGTTSPEQKLHVDGTVKIGDTLILQEDGTNDLVQSTGNVLYLKAPEFNFQDNSGNQQFYTTSSRNFIVQNSLGVGTNSLVSGAQLTLGGGSRIAPVSGNGLNLAAGGSDRMFISTGGNVGIGTTSPSEKLTVAGPIGVSATGYTANATTANFGLYTSGLVDTTYIQMPASGQFQVWQPSTGAVVTVLESGNVGIGTASPAAPLHVNSDTEYQIKIQSTASAGASMQLYSAGAYAYTVYQHPNAQFRVGAYGGTSFTIRDQGNAADRLTIINNGNVGIGNTSPNVKLEVQGSSASTYSGSGPGATIIASQGTDGNWIASNVEGKFAYFGIDGNDGKFAAYNYATSTEMGMVLGQSRMYIKNNGNVGINESSPDAYLHITGKTSYTTANSSEVSGLGFVRLQPNSNSEHSLWFHNAANNLGISGYTDAATSGSRDITLQTYGGNVGIGTTSPAYTFDLSSATAGYIARFKSTGNYGGVLLDSSGSLGGAYLGVARTGTRSGLFGVSGAWKGDTTNNVAIAAETGFDLRFYTNGTPYEKVIIDTAGNLLIGTDVAAAKLYVYTGTGGTITKFEGPAGRYVYSGADSGGYYMEVVGTQASERILRLQGNNGSGTYTQLFIDAGAQRIYTSSSASVGIGTASPTSKLTVYGSSSINNFASKKIESRRWVDKFTSGASISVAVVSMESGDGASQLAGFVFTFTYRTSYGFNSGGGGHGVLMISGRVSNTGTWTFDTSDSTLVGDGPDPTVSGTDNGNNTATITITTPASTHAFGELHLTAWDCTIT